MPNFNCFSAAVVFFVVTLSNSTVRADVYRCVLQDGHVSYQQIPCSSDSEPLKLKTGRSGWTPLRQGERDLLDSYRNKNEVRRPKPAAQPDAAAGQSRICWNRRKQLEAVRLKLRRGYKLKEGDRLQRERLNHEDYLRQFCS